MPPNTTRPAATASPPAADLSELAALADPRTLAAVELELARRLCRAGNPFPLVALQWPELVVQPSDKNAKIFRDNLKLAESADITDSMKSAILDPDNPLLRLDWWQYITIAAFFEPTFGEVFIAGATGVGKGASVSVAVNLFYDVHAECRVHLTGRDRVHARNNIFGETIKWRERMRRPGPGDALSEAINDTKRHYVMLLNPDISSATAGEAFSGAHGKNTLYVFDEASSHPDSFIENARRNAHLIVAAANPRSLFGFFRNGFSKLPADRRIGIVPGDLRMRLCMQIGGLDCLNVRYRRLKIPVAPKDGIVIDDRLHA